jgi:hypothetical protein
MPTNDLETLTNLSMDAQVKTFVQLKEKRAQLSKLKEELDARYDAIRASLLNIMTDKKVLTLKTEEYTVVRTHRRVVSIPDQDQAIEYFKKQGVPLPVKIDYWSALPTINSALSQDKKIPGVEEKSAEYVSVRLNKAKTPTSHD